mmetsp:Transcript_165650/g.531749  ORF Transcript_165650/g.531749 Transcript_165650/m.531749 type:complete len:285 (+) Transcript_165650:504-1358(+)
MHEGTEVAHAEEEHSQVELVTLVEPRLDVPLQDPYFLLGVCLATPWRSSGGSNSSSNLMARQHRPELGLARGGGLLGTAHPPFRPNDVRHQHRRGRGHQGWQKPRGCTAGPPPTSHPEQHGGKGSGARSESHQAECQWSLLPQQEPGVRTCQKLHAVGIRRVRLFQDKLDLGRGPPSATELPQGHQEVVEGPQHPGLGVVLGRREGREPVFADEPSSVQVLVRSALPRQDAVPIVLVPAGVGSLLSTLATSWGDLTTASAVLRHSRCRREGLRTPARTRQVAAT